MNTTINPSRSTEEQHTTAGAEDEHRDLVGSARAAYATPIGAEHRTFELSVDSPSEMWLLTTCTSWAGERLWVSSICPFEPAKLKMTFRPETLELPELHWLLDLLNLNLDSRDASALGVTTPPVKKREPRPGVLLALAEHVHKLLSQFDVVAMVKDLAPVIDRAHFDVATWNIPDAHHDLPAFDEHMRICVDCLSLAYVDDSYLR